MIEDHASWNITILATDINRRLLEKAERGVYGVWSFRGCPAGLRRRFFRTLGDGREEVLPEIRRMVHFSFHNLAVDELPRAMDIIVCKNVLMYLSAEARSRALGGFRDSLVNGGFLLVSPTEASMPREVGFVPAESASAVAFTAGITPPLPEENVPVMAEAWMPEPEPHARASRAPTRTVRSPGQTPEDLLQGARSLADRGRLAQALTACRAAIAADRSGAASHYLEGTILEEMGRTAEALSSLRRALYLDPEYVMAHFSLGLLALKRGNKALSERYFRNAVRLLEGRPDGEPIPWSDGLTAQGLRELAQLYTREARGVSGPALPAGSVS